VFGRATKPRNTFDAKAGLAVSPAMNDNGLTSPCGVLPTQPKFPLGRGRKSSRHRLLSYFLQRRRLIRVSRLYKHGIQRLLLGTKPTNSTQTLRRQQLTQSGRCGDGPWQRQARTGREHHG
jgi:hypothetical protein